MKLLLDTHVLFWSLANDPKLPPHYPKLMADMQNTTYVSVVTGWEIATKVRIGKWPEATLLLPGLAEKVRKASFFIETLTLEQAERAGGFDSAHKDPFDRLLAAQALDRGMTLLTVDPAFASFGCSIL